MNTYKVSSLFTAVGLTVTLVGGCASERADENTVVVGALSNPAAAPVPSPDVTRLALMNSIYESVNTKIISGANVYNVGREHKAVVSGSTLLFGKCTRSRVSPCVPCRTV